MTTTAMQASAALLALIASAPGRPGPEPLSIEPERTAVVVIDMWDRHWCKTYTARVANLVPRMNRTLDAARKLGIQVVFAPSDVVGFYKDDPRRNAMLAVPPQPAPARIAFDPPPAPAGDFCECGPDQPCGKGGVWTRQHPDLVIRDGDLIADCNEASELLSLCTARKIRKLIYMGVASNMCVLYRASGMINMKRHGLDLVFVRDLVESIMANGFDPARKVPDPNWTPARGSAFVRRYIERHIAPSIESRQLIEAAGMGSADKRPSIAIAISEPEYETARTLSAFAEVHLAKDVRLAFIHANPADGDDLRGLDALYDADLLVLSMRRRFPSVPQMDILERFIRSGKPIVAIRTSVVPFARGGGSAPRPGHVSWESFDQEILGCHYQGYDADSRKTGCDVWMAAEAASHPILAGIEPARWHSPSWLYKVRPLREDAKPLLLGRWSQEKPEEPVAWTTAYEGARIFYTSLGHPGDFEEPAFARLLANAIRWALGG